MAQHPIDPVQGGTGVKNNNASTITVSGSFPLTLTLAASSNVTLPTSGTLITSGTAITASQLPAFSGDVSSTAGTSVLTLATVNSNVSSFGDTTHVGAFTVNGKGLITAASNQAIAFPVTSVTGSGSGILVTPTTGAIVVSNTGVTSLAGTANQIAVSGSTGAVTLSMPQNVIIPTPSSGIGLTAAGVAGNYAAQFVGNSSANNSFGVNIAAGTSASDAALAITNKVATATFFQVNGNGSGTLGPSASLGLSWTAAGNITIATPSSGVALQVTGIGSSASQALIVRATVGTSPATVDAGEIMNITNLSTTGDQRLLSFGQVGTAAFIRPIQQGASAPADLVIATQSGGTTFGHAGNVTIAAPTSGVGVGITGVAGSIFVAHALQVSSPNTASSSNGVRIIAGTNSSDSQLILTNAANTGNLWIFGGDGGLYSNGQTSAGAGTITISGAMTAGSVSASNATFSSAITVANIFGASTSAAYTIAANPVSSFSSGGFVQLFGSTASPAAEVVIGAAGVGTIVVNSAGAAVTGLLTASSMAVSTPNGVSASLLLNQTSAVAWAMYVPASSSDIRWNDGTADRMTLNATSGNLSIHGAFSGAGTGLTGTAASLTSGATNAFNITNNATGTPADLVVATSTSLVQYSGGATLSSSGVLTATSSVNAPTLTATSDRNLKTNIRTIDSASDIIASLNGVRFDWKSTGLPSAGLIAQDVEAVMPELVATNKESKVLNYNGIIGVLVEAVKEMSATIASLKVEIEALKVR